MDFPLFPWDRKRPRLHTPQAQNTLVWHDKTYGLRAQNGLLFLRAQGESKTLAVATPLTETQENAVEDFPKIARGALRRGDIARFVVVYDEWLERTLTLFLRAGGTGFCRESWNRDDLEFRHEISMHEWMEAADEVLAARADALGLEELHAQLSALGTFERRDLEWICGSLETLEPLARWICWLETQIWRQGLGLVLDIRSENEFGRASVCGWEMPGSNGDWWSATLDGARDQLEVWMEKSPRPTQRFMRLFDLALDENTPTSLGWEYHDYGAGRCSNAPESQIIQIEVPMPTDEQVARARHSLRQWLHGKMPAAEIEAVLNNDAPVELPKTKWYRE